jgi:pimeloyl-ACP methyl ester carboxylesterase
MTVETRVNSEFVAFAHATGFCKEVWGPVGEQLAGRPFTAWDAPGHGDANGFVPPADWWSFARHALDVLEPFDGHPIGVGHSMGGATLLMAEVLRPGRFKALVVIEPIIFPPPYRRMEHIPLAEGALRRRDGFHSREAIIDNYRGKDPFASWSPDVLAAYVDGGFVERDGRWWLKCRPEVEAEVYRAATAHGLYDRLDEVGCPVLVLAGENSTTLSDASTAALTRRMPNARYEIVAGASHFLPMERPGLVADEIVGYFDS